ncbi:MAG TPA: hypothetical protein VEC92_02180 [Nitrososphaerales archaeon]|nr:hypothetical protein [Nitrososphaerales archaeon]
MKFTEKQEFTGDPAQVWSRLSNLRTIPTYWHGTREFTATKSGGKITADVVFAFGGKGKAEVTVDEAERTFILDYFEGPFKGRQKTTVKENAIEAEWDVTFRGAYKVLGPWNASHFRSGTKHALLRLCEGQTAQSEAQSASTSSP